ncbi:MAG: hypothetical protein R3B48_12100 [Kofleriaceae bacterium]
MSAAESPPREGGAAVVGAGTAAPSADAGLSAEAAASVSRAELELALRAAHLAIAELREDLHALAAQVVALTEADRDAAALAALEARAAELTAELAASDARAAGRVRLGAALDKYALAADDGPPCAELLPVCGARCCTFEVALSTQDLDDGALRWSYATPYLLDKQPSGQCAYHDGAGCTAYARRPATCRTYDCRGDARVWKDFAARELAPLPASGAAAPSRPQLERDARDRQLALFVEASRLRRRG